MHTNAVIEQFRQAAFNSAPRRLQRIVSYARILGSAGVEAGSAREAIEDALWGDGMLPHDRPSQRNAWRLGIEHSDVAYRDGALEALKRSAADSVAKHGQGYRAAYVTTWLCCTFASDAEIAEATGIAAGLPWCPIRRARDAHAADRHGELNSFDLPEEEPGLAVFSESEDGSPVLFGVGGLENAISKADRATDGAEIEAAGPHDADWKPLDLRNPAAWTNPPRALFPVALIDEEDAAKTAAPVADVADLTSPPGLVGALIDWMEASSDRPNRALLLGAALTLVGTLAGRRYASPSNLRTNNMIVTLAPSGHGKDHALSQIKFLTEAANLDRYIGPARIMSASALRKLVKREPAVACFMDEFGGVMAQIHDKRAGIHNTMIRNDLLEMFSAAGTFFAGAEYAAEPATKIYAPNLSISGTSTPSQFWASLSTMSASDGLLARMIMLAVDGPKPPRRVPLAGPRDVSADLVKALHGLAEARSSGNLAKLRDGSPEPYVVPFSDDAQTVLVALTDELDASEAGADEGALPFINRCREHAIKLALVVAIGENPDMPVISGATMDWAARLARSSMQTLVAECHDRIADNDRGAAVNKVLALVKGAGKAGITEGRIFDRARGIDTRMREQILRDLQTAGRIRFERNSATGKGRCSERYFVC